MGYFFLDDSVHDNAKFIIVACVYTENDPTTAISELITRNGFDPVGFEFKSSAKYARDPQMMGVRENLRSFLSENCGIALAVIPRQQRDNLGFECLKAVKQFLGTNKRLKPPHKIYIDQGMFLSDKKVKNYITDNDIEGCEIFVEQDSQLVKGIQLADLAAHTAAIIFKEKLGLINKKVILGKDFGYEPDLEADLGFELWAPIRYCFFRETSPTVCTGDRTNDATLKVEPRGLYVSEYCDAVLAEKARDAFGSVCLGCLH